MQLERHIYKSLLEWKSEIPRKPLVLRGARQVGKTTLVKQFAKLFKNKILLNLEKSADIDFFNRYSDAKTLVDALFLKNNIKFDEMNNTILFIDEIQESPEAISMLRYFYEDIPELNVIAAGSLLEHALKKVKSFPVGRISYLFMHPLNFEEFLEATGHQMLLEEMQTIPISKTAHPLLLEAFKKYVVIGGMPEIVSKYIDKGSVASLPPIYESIWETYKNDIQKYATGETNANVMKHIVDVAHLFFDERVKFQNFGNSNYRSREVGEAFRSLDAAKIIQLIYPTTSLNTPIIPDLKKSPRLQFLDVGILNHELKIQEELLALDDLNSIYKGAIIPQVIFQELLSLNKTTYKKPAFWVREKTQASAEVDIVMNFNNLVVPIEIKSGSTGSLKSLHQFIDNANHSYAVRIYAGEFRIEESVTPSGKPYLLMNIPYYLGGKIKEYLSYFVKTKK